MDHLSFICSYVDQNEKKFTELSDEIWSCAETRFEEYRSSKLQQELMLREGFSVRADLAGEKTAFIAEYGSGKPVIALMGEFDALEGMSQEADVSQCRPLDEGKPGHGCGHNLLGVGALAAAVTLKALMERENLSGTIRYYGCPAEENAGGKAFLVRDGNSPTATWPFPGIPLPITRWSTAAPTPTTGCFSPSRAGQPMHPILLT